MEMEMEMDDGGREGGREGGRAASRHRRHDMTHMHGAEPGLPSPAGREGKGKEGNSQESQNRHTRTEHRAPSTKHRDGEDTVLDTGLGDEDEVAGRGSTDNICCIAD
jgi:hypothetical protein